MYIEILLVGVTHTRNTYIHSVDEALGIANRLTSETTFLQIVMPDGSMKGVQMHRHSDSFSDHYDKLKQAFFELGAARQVKFGDADCILCDAAGIFEVCAKIFGRDADEFISVDELAEKDAKREELIKHIEECEAQGYDMSAYREDLGLPPAEKAPGEGLVEKESGLTTSVQQADNPHIMRTCGEVDGRMPGCDHNCKLCYRKHCKYRNVNY